MIEMQVFNDLSLSHERRESVGHTSKTTFSDEEYPHSMSTSLLSSDDQLHHSRKKAKSMDIDRNHHNKKYKLDNQKISKEFS
jgi:hypothetical protein